MRNRVGLYVSFVVFCLMLTGCLSTPRMETVIMEDTEPERNDGEASMFTVKTIYTVLDGDKEALAPLGWKDSNALLGITSGSAGGSQFVRVNEPYAAKQRLFPAAPYAGEGAYSSVALSPDGRYVSFVELNDGQFILHLHSLDDGENIRLEITGSKYISLTQMSWSNNSRFFSYVDLDEKDEAALFVYDTAEGKKRQYSLLNALSNGFVLSVSVSDNGEDAVMVKDLGVDNMLAWGKLSGDAFIAHYEYPISAEGQVEWIHQDQIAFVGKDGTLLAYDRRNHLLSTLIDDVGRFRLSSDGKHIAYTQGNAVFAANVYGNTVLNRKQIYKGIEAYGMEWSPNHAKLLLHGSRSGSLPRSQERTLVGALNMNQSFIIAFKRQEI